MSLLESVLASLVLMIGTSAAAQMWSQGLRSSLELARREEGLQRLEGLLLSSEGLAREQADRTGAGSDCPTAVAQLQSGLRALPPAREATLTLPPTPPGTLHLRWDSQGLRRERVFSLSAWRLCREADHGA
jgi:hypothetical protein